MNVWKGIFTSGNFFIFAMMLTDTYLTVPLIFWLSETKIVRTLRGNLVSLRVACPISDKLRLSALQSLTTQSPNVCLDPMH